ncbi:hypothetical protein MPS_4718 [Mycobacterium pseudoshottsii JCM 15466]|nr:hypothetical protein MMSP_3284 [Mycobacterium sp. 012931]GAQ39509.1 hypothetical protein MPS_4718 [Mycobacterium pseudoshottsii JCM 15466]
MLVVGQRGECGGIGHIDHIDHPSHCPLRDGPSRRKAQTPLLRGQESSPTGDRPATGVVRGWMTCQQRPFQGRCQPSNF